MNSESKDNGLLPLASVAASIVAFQLAGAHLLSFIYPQVLGLQAWLMAALFFGMAAGEWGRLQTLAGRKTLLAAAAASTVLALSLSPLILAGSWPIRLAVFVYLATLSIFCGNLLAREIYGSISRPYFKLNLLCAFWVAGLTVLLPAIGIRGQILFLSAALLACAWQERTARPNAALRKLDFDGGSMLLGVISSVYLAYVYQIQNLALYPTGLEFPAVLFFSFLALGMSARLAEGLPARLTAVRMTIGSTIVFVILLAVMTWTRAGGEFVFSLEGLARGAPVKAMLGLSFVFLLPYLGFALLWPLRQREKPGRNHLFSLAGGNALGFLFSLLLFSLPPPFELDRRIAAQGLALRSAHLWGNQEDVPPNPVTNLNTVSPVFRSVGSAGYVFDLGGNRSNLGLGGYSSPGNQLFDLLRARVSAELAKPAAKILILGLGNQQIIAAVLAKQETASIAVVDNFAPFKNPEFRRLVSADDFLERPNVHFHLRDALAFLREDTEKYDLIVWNLTWPTFGAARKLFTAEFFGLMQARLAPRGIFVGESLGTPGIDCLAVKAFNKVVHVPRAGHHPAAVLAATDNGALNPEFPAFDAKICRDISLPNFSNPFTLGRSAFEYGFGVRRLQRPQSLSPAAPGYLASLSRVANREGVPGIVLTKDAEVPREWLEWERKGRGRYLVTPDPAYSWNARVFEAVVLAQHHRRAVVFTDARDEVRPVFEASGIAPSRIFSRPRSATD